MRPRITDLLAGHTDVMTANLDSVLAQVQEGKLKGLAVTSEKRAPELPDLPAIAETYPEVVSTSWFAVVAPPKTPPEIAEKLSRAFAEILREPEIEKKMARDDADAGRRHARRGRRFSEGRDRALAQGYRVGRHQAAMSAGDRMPCRRCRSLRSR